MNTLNNNDIDTDIDYEHLDDLPLTDHIDWQYSETDNVSSDNNYDLDDLAVA